MKPHTLEEFAQELRLKGDYREADFADEILALLDIEEEVAEPYSNLCDDLNNAAPKGLEDKPEKQMEWVIDRSNELDEIYELFSKEKLGEQGVVDAIREMVETTAQAEALIERAGWPGSGEFIEALETIIERAERAPEEIEVMTYDL
jgi:predicted CopG family antitoxin